MWMNTYTALPVEGQTPRGASTVCQSWGAGRLGAIWCCPWFIEEEGEEEKTGSDIANQWQIQGSRYGVNSH